MKDVYTLADLCDWKAVAGREDPAIRLGVFGDPIAHSVSPQMQNAALKECGIESRYARFEIRPNELAQALYLLPRLGFHGINLTVPHKVAALDLVHELDESAGNAGAVNTIRVEGEKLVGFNTDGRGFSRAIREEFAVDLRELRVLLLGAGGGAGQAIARQCALEKCERLALVNRTLEKAEALVADLGRKFPTAGVEAVAWNEDVLGREIAKSDLVVNATSLGMKEADPPVLSASLLAPHLMVYDAIYNPARTPLLQASAEAGARGANGLSMLLHQGALAFEIWFDQEAPLEAMRAALHL